MNLNQNGPFGSMIAMHFRKTIYQIAAAAIARGVQQFGTSNLQTIECRTKA
jgi:hypothetical protein